jgi:hypothetical protein
MKRHTLTWSKTCAAANRPPALRSTTRENFNIHFTTHAPHSGVAELGSLGRLQSGTNNEQMRQELRMLCPIRRRVGATTVREGTRNKTTDEHRWTRIPSRFYLCSSASICGYPSPKFRRNTQQNGTGHAGCSSRLPSHAMGPACLRLLLRAMTESTLTAFWIVGRDPAGPLGFGVTAFSITDALEIVRRAGYRLPDDTSTLQVRSNVKPADIEYPHVCRHMGPIVGRGVWYPFVDVGLGA